jgi:hypothetical protein
MSKEEKQVCEHCDYPLEAGHSKDCPTRDSESAEMRKEGYALFIKFLEKHGIDKMTKEQKVDKIKELDFDEVMQTISRVNGRLDKRDKRQEWKGETTGSQVRMGKGSVIELDPPENVQVELKKFFEEMKSDISVDNIDVWAVKTYMAIVFSHTFHNGNGRTARSVYHLLSKDGAPPEKLIQDRDITALKTTVVTSLYAITRVFEENGMKGFKDDPKMLNPYGIDIVFRGNMTYLKFLSAKIVLEREGKYNDEKNLDIDGLTEEQKEKYEEEYQRLRKEWFWKVQEFCEDQNESLKNHLGGLLK